MIQMRQDPALLGQMKSIDLDLVYESISQMSKEQVELLMNGDPA